MVLPDSYTLKAGTIPAYFEAIKNAEAPQRFSVKFLEGLEFKSTNDRTFIGILKDLGFLDADGVPQPRYFQYLDRTQSERVLAEAIREAYAELFAVNKEAHKLSQDDVTNKLRTLYAGSKKDTVIKLIARTFVALCEVADFSSPVSSELPRKKVEESTKAPPAPGVTSIHPEEAPRQMGEIPRPPDVTLDSLQYHINLVLPETRDQAVYDALFKALREHLGTK